MKCGANLQPLLEALANSAWSNNTTQSYHAPGSFSHPTRPRNPLQLQGDCNYAPPLSPTTHLCLFGSPAQWHSFGHVLLLPCSRFQSYQFNLSISLKYQSMEEHEILFFKFFFLILLIYYNRIFSQKNTLVSRLENFLIPTSRYQKAAGYNK